MLLTREPPHQPMMAVFVLNIRVMISLVCIYAPVCASAFAHVYMYVRVFSFTFFFFLKTESFTEPSLEFTDFAKLSGQGALGIHLFPSPQSFVYQTAPPSLKAFTWVLGITPSLFHVCSKHLNQRSYLFSVDIRMCVIQRFPTLCGQEILGCLAKSGAGKLCSRCNFSTSVKQ